MEAIEICLLVIGLALVAATYIFSEKFEMKADDIKEEVSENTKKIVQEIVRDEVENELANVVDERIEAAAVELDKITTDKIMAVGNYSEETLATINKNHDEVMFLYNMLNEKEETLKNTVRDIEALKQSIKKMNVEYENKRVIEKKEDNSDIIELQMMLSEEQKREKVVSEKTDNNIDVELKEFGQDSIDDITNSSGNEYSVLNKEAYDEGKGNNNEEIIKLYNDGHTIMEIAKKLGLGLGEVRLVIDLFKK